MNFCFICILSVSSRSASCWIPTLAVSLSVPQAHHRAAVRCYHQTPGCFLIPRHVKPQTLLLFPRFLSFFWSSFCSTSAFLFSDFAVSWWKESEAVKKRWAGESGWKKQYKTVFSLEGSVADSESADACFNSSRVRVYINEEMYLRKHWLLLFSSHFH